MACWSTKHLTELIQPVALRAPEVLVGAPVGLDDGLVDLEVHRCAAIFTGKEHSDGPYEARIHLSEIVCGFIRPPPRVSSRERRLGNRRPLLQGGRHYQGVRLRHRTTGLDDDLYMEELSRETRQSFPSFLHALIKVEPAEAAADA
ncbi:hypothetical protein IMZ48_45680 [Candidatus Bathyarchaeota archaeon]|nr:hypothetical protein [Candidatus Bathyarchaeota archaeon]